MNEDATTFGASTTAPSGRNLATAEILRVLGRRLGLCTRVAGVVVFGCILLVSLFALQVAALELSDRLNIFPLYGFFFVNLCCGLFLVRFIFKFRNFSSLLNQAAVQTALGSPRQLRMLWARILGVLNLQKTKEQSWAKTKPVAILLIIKRESNVESTPKSRAASA